MAIIAPYVRWSARDLIGDAAIFGQVFTFQSGTRIPKDTYSDPSQTTANPNPVALDGKGEANIYWDTETTFYTIKLYDRTGQLILTQDNYPNTGIGVEPPPIVINETPQNIIRNPQFAFWNLSDRYVDNVTQYLGADIAENFANDWTYESSSDTAATVQLNRVSIGPELPGNPIYGLRYIVNVLDPFTSNIFQRYDSVQTLAMTEISFGMWVLPLGDTVITVEVSQIFGTGGSPSATTNTVIVETPVLAINGWQKITGTATIPSIIGKTLGTNDDDSLLLVIGPSANASSNTVFTALQLVVGNTLPDLIETTINDQGKQLDDFFYSSFRTGDVKYSINPLPISGWIPANDGRIGRVNTNSTYSGFAYFKLFVFIWDYISNTYSPIFDANGTPTVRGASAIDDWNNFKSISLPRMCGRMLRGAGTGSGLPAVVDGQYGGTIPALTSESIDPLPEADSDLNPYIALWPFIKL